MTTHKDQLNRFFVSTFNYILALEERHFPQHGIKNLSVKESHILEVVAVLEKSGENTMSKVAKRLNISVGALTTAVNVLVNKGYLVRENKSGDRRIVLIVLTEIGREADDLHTQFHQDMIDKVVEELDDEQLILLTESLEQLSDFFDKWKDK